MDIYSWRGTSRLTNTRKQATNENINRITMDSKFSTEEKNLNDPLLEFARVPHRVTLFPEHFSRYSIFLFLSHFFPSSSFFFPPPPLSPSRTGQNGERGGRRGREENKKNKKKIGQSYQIGLIRFHLRIIIDWRVYTGLRLIPSKNKPISNKEPRFLDISNIILGQLNGYAINCANRFLERVLSTYHMRKICF